jgi:hypothetical protein
MAERETKKRAEKMAAEANLFQSTTIPCAAFISNFRHLPPIINSIYSATIAHTAKSARERNGRKFAGKRGSFIGSLFIMRRDY